jgi:hypothetical protein
MQKTYSVIISGIFLLLCGIAAYSQGFRKYISVSQAKNLTIKKYDTLPVGICYTLDNSTSIGVVQRKVLADMWVAVFKNNKWDLNTVTCDTMIYTDSTRFHFYHSAFPGDGQIILFESRYSFDSELRLYLFRNGVFTRLGRIDVDLRDPRKTHVHYPVSEIYISSDGKNVRVDFGKPLIHRISEPYDTSEYYLIFDGVSRLLPVINGNVKKPLW